jgi:hypothetical protein
MRRADNLTTFMYRLSINLGASTFWNPKGLSRPVMGLLYLRPVCTCSPTLFIIFTLNFSISSKKCNLCPFKCSITYRNCPSDVFLFFIIFRNDLIKLHSDTIRETQNPRRLSCSRTLLRI